MATETTKANTLIDADGLQTALEKVNDSCTRIKYVQGAPELPAATASRLNRIFVSDLTGAGTTTAEYAAYIAVQQSADSYAWLELNRKPDLSDYVTTPALAEALHTFGKSYVTTTAELCDTGRPDILAVRLRHHDSAEHRARRLRDH